MFASVPLLLTFASEGAATGYECQNRTLGAHCFARRNQTLIRCEMRLAEAPFH
jgi:hypothetical protein